MPILRFFPNLKDLNLYALGSYQTSPPISILPLLNCLNLEKLRIQDFTRPGWADVRETVSFLRKLKSLSLHIRVVEDFSFLCASPEYQWNYQDECQPANATRRMNDDDRCIHLPLLENLEVGAHSLPLDTTSDGTFRQCFRDILRTRHLLKRVVIFGHYFVIDDLFPQLGREIQDGWACINLETLSIWFECKNGGEIERREQWNRLFSQIGKLENLKRLAIRGYNLGFGSATGLSKLAPNGSIQLRELILDDGFGSKWTKEGVARMIEVMPNLECLYLKESRHKNYREIKAWVKELTQRDIEMNDFWRSYRWLTEF
ncbi:hypothetical protein BGZ49_007068 [Haplosporangium sp. Z 27]|nr:hypothetical protein BGZ49_007068 [Haplosporangium sp. Z 27]